MSTYSPNRGIARNYLPGMISLGYSGTEALTILQDNKIGYKNQDFQADWREFTGLEKKKDTFKYIRHDLKPDVGSFTPTSDNLSREYSYIFEIKGKDSITGEPRETAWQVSTDDLLSLNDAMDAAEGYMLDPEYGENIEDYDIKVVGVKRAMHL